MSVPFFWQILPILRAVLVLGSEKSRDDDNYPKKKRTYNTYKLEQRKKVDCKY